METGDLITLYRKQAGLTIDELVEKSGVPKGTLNKIIGGVTKAPTLDNMKSIAKALGKTLADFDDLPVESKTTPSTAEAAPGAADKVTHDRALKLYRALVSAGFLREGEDLTPEQIDVLDGLSVIISATFD